MTQLIEVREYGKGEMTEGESKLLLDINGHRFSPVISRYERLGRSARAGNTAKENLLARELIKEYKISIGRKNLVFFTLTKKAVELLSDYGQKDLGFWLDDRVSFKHRLYQNLVKNKFEFEGCEAVIEKPREFSGEVDITVLPKGSGKKIAVEVTLNYKNAFENIQKNLREYDEVIIVYEHPYTRSIVKDWVERRLPEEKRKLVKFEDIKEYAAYVGV